MPSEERIPFASSIAQLFLLLGLSLINGLVFSFIGISLAKLITGVTITGDLSFTSPMNSAVRTAFLFSTGFASIGTFGFSTFMFLKLSRFDAGSSLNLNLFPVPVWLFITGVMAFLMQPAISVITDFSFNMPFGNWYRKMLETAQEHEKLISNLISPSSYSDIILGFLVIAVIPAIVEEIFFRGALIPILSTFSRSKHAGVWISALVFGVFHQQYLHLPALTLAGALFGYVYLWTGNLWYPILLHFINNSLAFVLLILGKMYPDLDIIRSDYVYPLWLTIIASVALIALLYFFFSLRVTSSLHFKPSDEI